MTELERARRSEVRWRRLFRGALGTAVAALVAIPVVARALR
jgi:hypothetical protein